MITDSIVAVLCACSSTVTATFLVAHGYARKLYAAREELHDLKNDLSSALEVTQNAQNAQLQAERNLADFKNQMAEWLKKPVTVNWVMTPEQIDQLANNIKKTPENPPRFN